MAISYKRLPRFDYVKPGDMQEALDLLGRFEPGKGIVYVGGTDVIPKIKARSISAPDVLIDLKGLPGLDGIAYDDRKGLTIGALASIYSVAHSPVVRDRFSLIAQAASTIASTQIQNRGTIVGNICNAVPSADSAPALLCLGAEAVCISRAGERQIGLRDFFTGPGKTALQADELVREIRIPPLSGKGVYHKLSPRSRMDLAVVGVAVFVDADSGTFKDVRIGLGAVSPTPMRAVGAEAILRGERIGEPVIQEAARTASEEASPIDDHRASAEYRRLMVEVLVKRALTQMALN